MKKRLLTRFLCISICAGLISGCGSTNDSQDIASTEEPTTEQTAAEAVSEETEESVAASNETSIDTTSILTDYYDTTLAPEYGTADSDMAKYYIESEEGDGVFYDHFDGAPGLMGKSFADIDADEQDEMLVGNAIYDAEEGTINAQILVYDCDADTSVVSELTDGQIVSMNFGFCNDTIQCAYRVLDDGLYVYFTRVFTMTTWEGGYGDGWAFVYRLDANGVEELTSDPFADNAYPDEYSLMENVRDYMPTIVDAWYALSSNTDYNFVSDISTLASEGDTSNAPLFSPLSNTDSDYTDLFSWQMMKERDSTEYEWSFTDLALYGYFDFYE